MMVFLLHFRLPAFAAEQRVFDNADLLTAEEEQNLQQFCEDAKEEYDIDFAYLTTKDTEGLSTREYGAQFYIEQNLGVGEDYSGAIFVLDMGEREGQLVTCGEAMKMITDADADAIWDETAGYSLMEIIMAAWSSSGGTWIPFVRIIRPTAQKADQNRMRFLGKSRFEWWRHCDDCSACGSFFRSDAGVSVMSMRKACKNVHPFTDGRAYLKENGCYLRTNQDTFANTHTTMVPIPREDDNNHHHTGGFSGGGSFSGGGGKF